MTLAEVVYQIDGCLETSTNPDGTHKMVLKDNVHQPARVLRTVGPTNEGSREEVEAATTGATLDEARTNLTALLRGNILKHDWPAMWTSSTATLRIPRSLFAFDDIKDIFSL